MRCGERSVSRDGDGAYIDDDEPLEMGSVGLSFLETSKLGLHELVVGRDLLLRAARLGYKEGAAASQNLAGLEC
jgi:hypothetical protein